MNTQLAMDNDMSVEDAGADLHQYATTGDQQALERCLSACLQPAYRQAYAQLGHDADAQDVVQESLLQLVCSAQRYDPQRTLAPWLARHVSDACMRFRRSSVRRKRREEVAMSEIPTAHVPSADMDCEHDLVRSALEQLKEKDRAIISLHYFAGLSQADTGKALGISENAASVRLHRARCRMKKILENQGVGVSISGGAVAALALLPTMAQAAPLAPATLLPQVIATCTAATLPSTLISLSLYNKGIVFMSTHTVFTTVSIMMLSVAMCAGAVLWSAEEEAQVQNPIVKDVDKDEGPSWNPAAAKLLVFYDEQSVFAMAADADAVRALLLNTRPFKQLLGGKNDVLLKNWHEEILRYQAWVEPTNDIPLMMKVLPVMRGAFIQTYVRLDERPPVMVGMDAGGLGKELISRLLSRGSLGKLGKKIGEYATYTETLRNIEAAIDGDRVILSEGLALSDKKNQQKFHANLRKKADTAINKNLQRSPLWVTVNARPLLEAYLPLSAGTQSPVEEFWGTKWKELYPRIDVSVSEYKGDVRVQGTLRDVYTSGPFLAASLALATISRDVTLQSLQLRAPQNLPATDDSALAEVRLGCDIEKHAAVRDSLTEQLQDFGLSRLIDAWNGELLLRVHAGAPMPQPTIVIGLRKKSADLKRDIGKALQAFGAQQQTAPKGYTDAWTLLTPVGMLTCALSEDRLVLGTGLNIEKLIEKTVDDAGLSIDVDIPRIAQIYGPLVWGMIPQRSNFLGLNNRSVQGDFIEKLKDESNIDIRSEYFMPATVLNNVLPTQLRKNWLGVDGDIDSYISVWRVPAQDFGGQFGLMVIYRSQNAYCFMTDRFLPMRGTKFGSVGPSLQNLPEVEKILEGAQHIAGASLKDLQFHPRGAIPVLDRQRHIPSLPDLVAALPRYTLCWQQEKNGEQHFEETGLSLMIFGVFLAGRIVGMINPIAEEQRANSLRIKLQAFKTHKKRLTDLRRIADSMKGKDWNRPSTILQFAPVDALASLGLGEKPSAQQIDQLGRWYGLQAHFVDIYSTHADERGLVSESYGRVHWVLPLDTGVWVYFTKGDMGITTRIPSRPTTELKDFPQSATPDSIDF